MANSIDGTFTIRQMLILTKDNKPNRFDYRKRDVLKHIQIKRKVNLNPDRSSEPNISLLIESYSYPQYRPYFNERTARYSKQRKVRHQYDINLSIAVDPTDGKASVDTTKWKLRLGSEKKWVDKPSQKLIKSIYRETSKKWRLELNKDIDNLKRTISNRDKLSKAIKKRKKEYKDMVAEHKKKAPYLDVSDFNSQVKGINGDAYSLVHPVLQYYGHLYGKNINGGTGDIMKPFFPKHIINLVDQLLKVGVLK